MLQSHPLLATPGLPVMPITGKTRPDEYASKFSHDGEVVRPGTQGVFANARHHG